MAAYSAQPRATASEPFNERRINGVSMYSSARADTRERSNGTRAVPPYLFENIDSVIGSTAALDCLTRVDCCELGWCKPHSSMASIWIPPVAARRNTCSTGANIALSTPLDANISSSSPLVTVHRTCTLTISVTTSVLDTAHAGADSFQMETHAHPNLRLTLPTWPYRYHLRSALSCSHPSRKRCADELGAPVGPQHLAQVPVQVGQTRRLL